MAALESHGKSEKQQAYRDTLVLIEDQKGFTLGFHTPPSSGALSKIVGERPTSSMHFAVTRPDGPAPITATVFPLLLLSSPVAAAAVVVGVVSIVSMSSPPSWLQVGFATNTAAAIAAVLTFCFKIPRRRDSQLEEEKGDGTFLKQKTKKMLKDLSCRLLLLCTSLDELLKGRERPPTTLALLLLICCCPKDKSPLPIIVVIYILVDLV